MKSILYTALAGIVLSTAACVVYDEPSRYRYDHHAYYYDDNDRYYDDRPPHHCPPGHRKKGWC